MNQVLSFGDWVRRRRKILDLTQADLAQKVNCSVSMLRKIEKDQRRPSEQLAELLADALTIDEAQRAQFLQLARGQYVADIPEVDTAEFSGPAAPAADNGQRTGVRNPFIISSGAVLLLVIVLLLLSGAFNNWFGSPSSDNHAESSQPSDEVIAGQNEDISPTPMAINEMAAEPVAQPFAGTTVTIGGPFLDSKDTYEEAVRPFEEETGIDVEFESA